LLIATGQQTDGLINAAGDDVELLHTFFSDAVSLLFLDQESQLVPTQLFENRQDQVLSDGMVQDQAQLSSIFWNESKTRLNGLLGAAVIHLLAIEKNGTAQFRAQAEQGFQNLGPAATHQTSQAKNFTRLESKSDVIDFVVDFDRFQPEQVRGVYVIVARHPVKFMFGRFTTDQIRDNLLHRQVGDRVPQDELAITQNRDRVGDHLDLFHAVGNVDHRNAFCFERLDDFEKS